MEEVTHAVTWEAPEHHHFEKTSDWFWVLWIIAICAALAVFFFGNFLFAVLIVVAAGTMTLVANKPPKIIPFMVGTRGVRVGDSLYPYSTLESYFIDEDNPLGSQLLIKSRKLYMPLIIMPIPEEYIHDIEDLLVARLPEEELEEPLGHKILEALGF